jgi:hypothetical protein
MEKVLNITDRIEDKKRRRQVARYRNKIETIQRTVQCTSCQLKCSMCGSHVENARSSCPEILSAPDAIHTLCENCQGEFDEYLRIVRGETKPEVFWHNREWIRLWAAWLEYQRAMGEFKNSPEFRRLCEEFNG